MHADDLYTHLGRRIVAAREQIGALARTARHQQPPQQLPPQVAVLVGAHAPETITSDQHKEILHHLAIAPPHAYRRVYSGALHLLTHFNDSRLLHHREIREHLHPDEYGGLWVNFLRLSLALSMDGRTLGYVGETSARTVALCCAIAEDHANADLGSILSKFDRPNAMHAVTAFAIVTGLTELIADPPGCDAGPGREDAALWWTQHHS